MAGYLIIRGPEAGCQMSMVPNQEKRAQYPTNTRKQLSKTPQAVNITAG